MAVLVSTPLLPVQEYPFTIDTKIWAAGMDTPALVVGDSRVYDISVQWFSNGEIVFNANTLTYKPPKIIGGELFFFRDENTLLARVELPWSEPISGYNYQHIWQGPAAPDTGTSITLNPDVVPNIKWVKLTCYEHDA